MTAPINRLAFAFKQIEQSRKTITMAKELKRRDLDFVYQGLFLFAVKKFEAFLEDQIVGLAAGSVSWPSRNVEGKKVVVRPLLKEPSEEIVRSLMLASGEYSKLLPFSHCEKTAGHFLHKAIPFSLLDSNDKGRLTRCLAVRNLIAHDSDAAKKKFDQVVLSQHRLPSHRRNAAGFLRANFSQNQTFFEMELAALLQIARKLA